MNSNTPSCPQCREPIPPADISIAKGVAYCRGCNLLHDLADLFQDSELDFAPELTNPPAGTWLREDESGAIVGASHRSLKNALGILLATLFWNGLVSLFVMVALQGTLLQAGYEPPKWFWAQVSNPPEGLAILGLWLFLTPFLVIGTMMIGAFFSALFGRTEIRLQGREAFAFVGIGPIGLRRHFDPATVRSVKRVTNPENPQERPIVITHANGQSIKLPAMMPEARQRYLGAVLRRLLRENGNTAL